MPDGRRPTPGGWNRIHLVVEDLAARGGAPAERRGPLPQRLVTGPGGSQIVLDDPSGNPVELFVPRR
jgi:hypothetical protein